MLKTFVFILMVVNWEAVDSSEQNQRCGVAELDNEIDWEELPSTWYGSLHTPDEIFSNVVGCQVVNKFNKTADGALVFLTNYFSNGIKPKKMVAYQLKKNETATFFNMDLDDKMNIEALTSENTYDETALEEVARIKGTRESTFVTSDYSTYITVSFCNFNTGKLMNIIFTSTPNPPVDEILQIRNQLVDINAITPLEASNCSLMNFDK